MQDYNKRVPTILAALVLLCVIFASGFYTGQAAIPEQKKVRMVTNVEEGAPEAVDFEMFWEAWNAIDELYVPPQNGTTTEITTQNKVYGAIQGLAKSLEDPYTTYLPPEDSKIFKEDISGNFEGVGMEIGKREDLLTVISPLKGSPAMEAGLQSGDVILAIDEVSAAGMTIDEGVKRIRGERGTVVELTIAREGRKQSFTVEITRDVIDIPVIDAEYRDDGVFVIRLFNFSRDSSDQFRDALRTFMKTGSRKLILDLRGNPGGFLEAAVDMASWFLPTGKIVVQEDFGDERDTRLHRSRGYDVFGFDLSMAILVNQGTASAGEILAGALREHNRATLVGAQTFGKGSVQTLESIGGGSLKITIARWLTPKGVSISKNGLTPDISVSFSSTTPEGTDPQFTKALEILNQYE